MLFFKYLWCLMMPLLALALPEPDTLNQIANALQERATTNTTSSGLSGLLDGLLGSLDGIGNLLNEDTFKEIDTLLKNSASLLDDAGTNRTKNLIKNANDLLTPEFVKNTGDLVSSVSPLVTTISQLISGIISSLFGTG